MTGNNQPPLLLLALELVFAICDKLRLGDLKSLRLTCKLLAEELASLVLHHITISTRTHSTIYLTFSEVLSELQSLCRPNSAALICTRKITFRISPLDGSRIPDDDEGGILKGALLNAVSSLNCVETVTWYTWYCDPKWLQEAIWEAILSLAASIRHLTLRPLKSAHIGPLNDIESFTKLESINFAPTPDGDDVSVCSTVSKLYSSSSVLRSIDIQTCQAPYPSLHDLFSCSKNTPFGPRPLRHLGLTNFYVSLDEVTLPHLISLTSLTLSAYKLNPDPTAIWTALKVSGIHLEELDLGQNTMAVSLIDYLSAFSGLKKLRMHLIGSAEIAARFWSAAFPNHANTLEDFALYPGHEDEWCLYLSDRPLIVQCRKLKYLMLSIVAASEQGPLPSDVVLERAKAVIDMVVIDMPYLRQLTLQVIGRRVWGYAIKQIFEMRISNWLLKYELPASCQYLPRICVGGLHRNIQTVIPEDL